MQQSTASLRSKKYDLPSFLQLPTLRNVVENILLHRIFEVQRQSKRMCTRYNTVRDEISSVSCFSKPRNMEETKNPFEIDLEQTIDPRGRGEGEGGRNQRGNKTICAESRRYSHQSTIWNGISGFQSAANYWKIRGRQQWSGGRRAKQ